MNELVNPYQPPGDVTEVERGPLRDRIELDGQVSLHDIELLMRVSKIRYLFRFVAGLVLALLSFGLVTLTITNPAARAAMLPFAGVLVGLTVFFVAIDRFLLGARHRAKRLIKRHPFLVGSLRGYLDDFGITFFHEEADQYLQFSWLAFPEVVVSADGIRLDFRQPDDLFIAVAASCVDEFGEAHTREEVQRLRQLCAQPAVCQVLQDWSETPPHAIRFQNLVSATPLSARQLVMKRISTLFHWAAAAGFLATLYFEQGVFALAVIMLVSIGVSMFEERYGLHSEKLPYLLGQWGWLTKSGGRSYLPHGTTAFQWRDSASIEIKDSHLLAQFEDGNRLYITPTDLIDGEWSTLTDWISKQNVES